MNLGRFEKVELRQIWETEDRDFTPWLAKPENIEILSETVGITLEVQGVEQNVGPFRADILCVDADSFDSDAKHYILIENQLEVTDHKHLGQLMTYAAGLDAVTIIWIASKFTEEHRATLDWLNRITNDTFRFFGIEIEVFKIDNSLPAPRFNIVAKPNDWSKDVTKNALSQKARNARALRLEYWQQLSKFAIDRRSFLRVKEVESGYTSVYRFGKSWVGIDFSIPPKKNVIDIYLWIRFEKCPINFEELRERYEVKLAQNFEDTIEWHKITKGDFSAVVLQKESDSTNKEDWENQFKWFVDNGEKFANFFKPEIAKL